MNPDLPEDEFAAQILDCREYIADKTFLQAKLLFVAARLLQTVLDLSVLEKKRGRLIWTDQQRRTIELGIRDAERSYIRAKNEAEVAYMPDSLRRWFEENCHVEFEA